jgi:hypothetical protein
MKRQRQTPPESEAFLDSVFLCILLRQNARTLGVSTRATLTQPTAARAAAAGHFVTLGIINPGVSMMYVGGVCAFQQVIYDKSE